MTGLGIIPNPRFKLENHEDISRELSCIIKNNYDGPYRCYGRVPPQQKNKWNRLFELTFKWDPMDDERIQARYHEAMNDLLRYLMHNVRRSKHVQNGGRPKWIRPRIWQELKDQWETPEFKLCKLERISPPAFFDSMEHLPIHLPYEARVRGPVQYRWMYPFERRMKTLKHLAKNKYRPEASICEAYLDTEVSNFCSMYFSDEMETHMTHISTNEVGGTETDENAIEIFRNHGRPIGKGRRSTLSDQDYDLAYLCILLNCDEVEPFLGMFNEERCVGLEDRQKEMVRKNEFVTWFRKTILSGLWETTKYLDFLAEGPSSMITVYHGYVVNGYRFGSHLNG